MAATAKAALGLKRLAGVPDAGRKAAKPVYHYALSWKPGETPERAEMSRAVDERLKKLGMEDRQALIVAHSDTPAWTPRCGGRPRLALGTTPSTWASETL